MTCWKWFGSLIKEAGLELNENNKEKIESIIHKYIGQKSTYGHCSSDWKKALKEITANEKMREELLSQLKTLK
jgi:ABC-type iron transport system FetAB ATPase subunit